MRVNVAGPRSKAAQELLDAFTRFKLAKWHHTPGVDVRPREIMVFRLIRERGGGPGGAGITVSEISDFLGVTSPTVTQLLNSLEEGGFVERSADPSDRRAVRIRLTEKGESALNRAMASFFTAFDGLVEYLGEADSHALAELLSRASVYFSQNRRPY